MLSTITCTAALAAAPLIAQAAELRLSGPYKQDNLSIYLIHGRDRVQKTYLTLSEAIAQRKVVVYETGNVNQLQVQNISGEDVYIQSGDVVKGGRQDRVLKDDIIVPSASGKIDVSAFCVEHGRWTRRSGEPAGAFGASLNTIATPEMKRAVKVKGDQREVWAEVAASQARLEEKVGGSVRSSVSESSYQLTLESPKIKHAAEAYKKDLALLADQHADALGYVMAVNGKVTGADLYATHELFRKMWPKLLDSAAIEAIAAGKRAGRTPEPEMADVRAAATGYGARVLDERRLNRRTDAAKAELEKGMVFETKDAEAPAAPLHRSYVVK